MGQKTVGHNRTGSWNPRVNMHAPFTLPGYRRATVFPYIDFVTFPATHAVKRVKPCSNRKHHRAARLVDIPDRDRTV